VAEQTGYPPELLDLDLDLEADLGIDTVKQAETFAAIRETYDIARDDNLALRDYPTLAHVIGFVRDRDPLAAAGPRPTRPPRASHRPATTTGLHRRSRSGLGAFPRRVPVPVVRPAARLVRAHGRDDRCGQHRARARRRGWRGGGAHRAPRRAGRRGHLHGARCTHRRGGAAAEAAGRAGGIDGVFALAALDPEGPLDELDAEGWREASAGG
jgi:acyl carrier protein